MNYKFSCPHCEQCFEVPPGSKGRSKCPGCSNRVIVSDTAEEAKTLAAGNNVCEVRISGKGYKTKVVHLDQALAEALMGSSKSIGDEIFAHAWLVQQDDAIVVLIGTQKTGTLPSQKTKTLLSNAEYATSPFKNAPCALKCPARISVGNDGKRVLELCVIENPPPVPSVTLNLASIESKLAHVRGSLNNGLITGALSKITLRQCVEYFSYCKDDAEDIRHRARQDPSGPIYWTSIDRFDFQSPAEWYSQDGRFFAKLYFKHGELLLETIEERFKNIAEVFWITGSPPTPLTQTASHPYIFRDIGRSASLTICSLGKHVPAAMFESSFCHFWTNIKGVEHRAADGGSRLENLKDVQPGQALVVQYEPNNAVDPNAMALTTESKKHLGYLPKELSSILRFRNATIEVIAFDMQAHEPIVFVAVGSKNANQIQLRDYAKTAFKVPCEPDW